jgi:hypothetical protein
MKRTIDATNYRREKQLKYNEENNITPTQIVKPTREIIGYEYRSDKADARSYSGGADHIDIAADPVVQYMTPLPWRKPLPPPKSRCRPQLKNSILLKLPVCAMKCTVCRKILPKGTFYSILKLAGINKKDL